jgi:cation:H+ antiporter
MTSSWLLLVISLAIILVGCDLFTNGIEWAGKKLSLGEGAVGSVLAAVGTCMPETLIAILAIVFGEKSGVGDDIGIGAILGAPLMLSTLAFFITGLAVLYFSIVKKRTIKMRVDHRILGRDLSFFFVVFSLAAIASYLPGKPPKLCVAAALLALYGIYVRKTFLDNRRPDVDEDISPLHFRRNSQDPALWLVIGQAVLGIAVLVYGAHLFVNELTVVAAASGIRPLILSLIITPIATELPEKINSIIWVRQRKDTLAMGNISGAMVFQSSISPAIGMVFTEWKLDGQAVAVVVVALGSAATAWISMMVTKRLSPYALLTGGLFYAGYLWWVFASVPTTGFK